MTNDRCSGALAYSGRPNVRVHTDTYTRTRARARDRSIPVGASLRDKAANRARLYRDRIANKQAAGDFKGGLHEAQRWLLEELEKVRRQRPHDAPLVDAELTAKLAALAEAVPFYRPKKSEGQ